MYNGIIYNKLIILTFIITALWDVILRYMAFNYDKLPFLIQCYLPFIKDMKSYFQKHTLLAAALIAGFVGACTQPLIYMLLPFPNKENNIQYIIKFLTVSFIISALYGFIMKFSGLHPYLQIYYYDKLGVIKSMYHDGISGLIVQITLLIILNIL